MASTGSIIHSTDLQTNLHDLWKAALHKGFPIAAWQQPQSSVRHCVIDFSGEAQALELDLEESGTGFAVSPFLNEGKDTRWIKADLYFNTEGAWQEHPAADPIARQEFREALAQEALPAFLSESEPGNNGHTLNKEQDFTNLVKNAVEEIKGGTFQKIVLSRTKTADLPAGFDPVTYFERLCVDYKHAFVSIFYLPGEGIWVGASPEVLVSVEPGQVFRTMSLAGTQAREEGQKDGAASWTQKEIEEQALVSRYIVNCFKQIRLREYDEIGPRTVTAGNLMHLRTDFAVNMQEVNFPQLGTVMLKLLHPTSAVCGMPKQAALPYILAHEGYDRKYYSGFLGPVNVGGCSSLYVNLRCARMDGKTVTFYAGAGITAESDPAKEWRETEIKCHTLLSKMFSTL
jgi:isochorismate synthase